MRTAHRAPHTAHRTSRTAQRNWIPAFAGMTTKANRKP
jgi:hypothetical protein